MIKKRKEINSSYEHRSMEKRLNKRTHTLDVKDFFYSFFLQLRYSWLWERSNQLDETIDKIIKPVNGARRLFFKLIRSFCYIDLVHSHASVESVAHHIKKVWKCDSDSTLIMPVCSKNHRRPDGSSKLFYDLINALGTWDGSMMTSFFNDADSNISNGCNVILCDDFIGSGATMAKRVQKLQKNMQPGAKLYVVALAGMKDARDKVLNRLGTISYAPLWLDKGIKDSKNETIMVGMESLLSPTYKNEILEKCSLGYGKAGTLYYNEDYRIPNNVYPIFWWGALAGGKSYNSLFLRS